MKKARLPDDYDFTALIISTDAKNVSFNEDKQRFDPEWVSSKSGFTSNDVLSVYIKHNNGDWIKAAEYNYSTGEFSNVNDTYISSTASNSATIQTIKFKDGVDGYKLVTQNHRWFTQINANPTVSLKGTSSVKKLCGENIKIGLTNYSTGNIYEYNDSTNAFNINTLFTRSISAKDYALKIVPESSIEKYVTGTRNNKKKKQYTVSWKINMAETYRDNDGRHQITQNGGTFYDLCPVGSSPDTSSIEVKTGDTVIDPSDYKVSTIEDYNNSGRTRLKVEIEPKGTAYSMTFDTIHTWENLKDYSFDIYNSAVYETGNDEIADGLPDDGGTGNDKALLTDIDKTTDAARFIYSQDWHTADLVTSASNGLKKQVKALDDDRYSYETVTHPDETYSYKIRLADDSTTKTKGIIFFDSLENYTTPAGKTSDWHGTLKRVDTSNLTEKGIRPVVYYTDAENINIYDHHDLTEVDSKGSKIWKTEKEFGDISKATGYAIDASTKTDGSAYVMDKSESISAVVFMQSPKEAPSTMNEGITYNNIFVSDTTIADNGNESQNLIHQDYTQLKYRVSGKADFIKVSSKNNAQTISGIAFRLWGTSDYGDNVEMSAESSSKGHVVFNKIPKGTYKLQEISGNDDWLPDRNIYTVSVDKAGHTTITGLSKVTGDYLFPDKPRVHNDIKFYKRGTLTNHSIGGVSFKLTGTSAYGTEVSQTAASDAGGIVTFSNIEKGTYQLVETSTDADYIRDSQTFKVMIDEDANVTIYNAKGEALDTSGRYPVIHNEERYHDFTIRKVDADDPTGTYLSGAVFTLTGTSDLGNNVTKTATSDSNGEAQFLEIEKGSYILRETTAPENHQLDDKARIVTVDAAGNATIEGLTKDSAGDFVWQDAKLLSGKITITKIWQGDSGNNSDRPTPKIHISTRKPDTTSTNVSVKAALSSSKARLKTVHQEHANDAAAKVPVKKAKAKLSATLPASGTWGTCPWDLSSDGTLTIHAGTGASISGNYDEAPWYNYASQITSVKTDGKVVAPKGCSGLFAYFSKATSIDLSHFDTSKVTNMGYMFSHCSGLTSLDVTGFDTSKVTSMSYMFGGCSGLTSLDVSHFDTSNVTDMSCMFWGCSGLTSLDVTHFDTSKVTLMYYMFDGCSGLTSLDVTGFDTSKVTNMRYMFDGCSGLTLLDLSSFDTSKVTYMDRMFWGCSGLTSLALGNKYVNTKNRSTYLLGNWYRYATLSGKRVAKTAAISGTTLTGSSYDPTTQSGTWVKEGKTPTVDPSKYYEEYDSEDDKWTKNDDGTWSYTFDVYDENQTWYLWEDDLTDYTTTATKLNPVTIDGTKTQKGSLTNVGTIKPASLKLTKALSGKSLTDSDKARQFAFNITLTNTDATLFSGTKIYDDIIFNNGVGTVYLKGGESKTITDLPAGTKYTVTEANADGFTSSLSNGSGTLTAGTTAQVTATNTKSDVPTTDVTISKDLPSQYASQSPYKDDTFTFTINLSGLQANQDYTLSDGTSYKSDAVGDAAVKVSMKAGSSVIIKSIPVGAKYKISEAGITKDTYAYEASYTITDANGKSSIKSTKGSGKAWQGVTSETETADNGEAVTMAFTNKPEPRKVKSMLNMAVIKKDASSNTPLANATFNLKGPSADGMEDIDINQITDSDGKAGFKNITAGTYTLTETKAPDGYAVDSTPHTITIDANGTSTTSTELFSLTKDDSKDSGIITFEQKDNKETLGELKVKKVDSADTSKTLKNARFSLSDANGKVVRAQTNDDGIATFTNLAAGDYTLAEIAAPDGYKLYDKTYPVKVAIDGTTATVTVTGLSKDNDGNYLFGDVKETEVKFSKTEKDGTPLKGAKLELLDSSQKTVATWMSTDDPYAIKLTDGSYTFKELQAPAKYETAKEIAFTVKDGKISIDGKEQSSLTVTMVDKYAPITMPFTGQKTFIFLLAAGALIFAISAAAYKQKKLTE